MKQHTFIFLPYFWKKLNAVSELGGFCCCCSSKIYSEETGDYFSSVSKSQRDAAALCNALGVRVTSCLHPTTYPSDLGRIWEVMAKSKPINTEVALFQRTIISKLSLHHKYMPFTNIISNFTRHLWKSSIYCC